MRKRLFGIAAIGALSLAVLGLWIATDSQTKPTVNSVISVRPIPTQAPSGVRIVPTASGFTITGAKACDASGPGWKSLAKPVVPEFPKSYADAVRVRSGIADVSALPVGGRDSAGTIAEDGSLVYKDAFEGCDVQYRCTELKTEEFIIVRDAKSQTSWSWDLDLGKGESALKPRLTAMHTIELVDGKGVPRLRIDAPNGIDADGKLLREGKELTFKLDGTRLTLTSDLSGARFPVKVDPSWSSTGSMATARYRFTVTRLNDGRVLASGGANPFQIFNSAELYDPVTATWSSTANTMIYPQADHTATLLADGRVLVAGGGVSELFDPANNTWTASENMIADRAYHTAVLLGSGNVLVMAGLENRSPYSRLSSCEIYDVSNGSWMQTGSMAVTRTNHVAIMLSNGSVLVAGGYNGSQNLKTCEVFDPSSGSWAATGDMAVSRSGHQLARLNATSLLCMSGADVNNTNVVSCEVYNELNGLWSATADLATPHGGGAATILPNGDVLLTSGGGVSNAFTRPLTNSCEIFLRAKMQWFTTASLSTARVTHGSVLLTNGTVLVVGGTDSQVHNFATCEIFDPTPIAMVDPVTVHNGKPASLTLLSDSIAKPESFTVLSLPQHGSLTGIPPNLSFTAFSNYNGSDSFTYRVSDIYGNSPAATVSINVTDTPPVVTGANLNSHFNVPLQFTLLASDADGDTLTYTVSLPAHGVVGISTNGNATYIPNAGYVGVDSIAFKVNDGVFDSQIATVSINVTNRAPTVAASGSPTILTEGESVSFTSTGSDPDNDSLSYSWDFGDGLASTAASPVHTYSTAGTYIATVMVADAAGATGTATVVVHVYKNLDRPTARFTTSEVVAFASAPFTFDASFSSDPGNAITSYVWDFGDGSANGSGQVISRVYAQTGPITATLTVTNALGLSDSLSRVIEVLPANEIGLFNSTIKYTVKWDRVHANADSLTMTAIINVGDAQIAANTAVALEIAGQRFTGTVDRKLRDTTNSDDKWQVQANIRGKPFGEAIVKVTIKNASLGTGFNLLGAVASADLHDIISVDIPLHIELAGRTFDILIPSDFKFSSGGTKAKGGGTGPE